MLIKLRFRFSEIFFGALLTIAIFAMGMVLGASRHQPPNAQASAQAQQTQTAHKPEPFTIDWLTHDGVVFFTAVLCFVVFVQAGLFVWQLIYMRKGLRDTRVAAEAAREAAITQTSEFLASNRPKIRIKHVFLSDSLWHGKPLVANVVCVNNGTTEAFIDEYGAKIFVLPKDKSIPFPNHGIPAIASMKDALVCGLVLHLPSILDGTILTDAQHVGIRNGTIKLYCAGYVHYRDSARRRRTTGFCRVLTLPDNAVAEEMGRFRVVDDPDLEYQD